jgi:hypothetical protein
MLPLATLVGGRLVVMQSEKGGLAQPTLRGAFHEPDICAITFRARPVHFRREGPRRPVAFWVLPAGWPDRADCPLRGCDRRAKPLSGRYGV